MSVKEDEKITNESDKRKGQEQLNKKPPHTSV